MYKKLLLAVIPLLLISSTPDTQPETKEIAKIEKSASPIPLPIMEKKRASLDLSKVFFASPIIYSLLISMSVSSLAIWLYSLATIKEKDIAPISFIQSVKEQLRKKHYDDALAFCEGKNLFLSKMLSCGLQNRLHGSDAMLDAMKSEGKRASAAGWQRLSLLNDIVVIAPMLGLLGTVIGMFYAFYDVNRSMESITALFDGLGIAVGTTVAGLIVSILSMIFHTTLKYRLVTAVSLIENEALSLASLIEA